jgi:Excinuclease ATPase subunit
MHDILYKGLAREMNDNTSVDLETRCNRGTDQIETVRLIDHRHRADTRSIQQRTLSLDYVRELLQKPIIKQRGYAKAGLIHVKGGRCETVVGRER